MIIATSRQTAGASVAHWNNGTFFARGQGPRSEAGQAKKNKKEMTDVSGAH
jgi:hypothetical protein